MKIRIYIRTHKKNDTNKYPNKYLDELYSNIFVTHCIRQIEDHTKQFRESTRPVGDPANHWGSLNK